MCSKEAWEHFIFIPRQPPRRLARAREHSDFLKVCSRPAADGKESKCRGWSSLRSTHTRCGAWAAAASTYSADAAAAAALTSAGSHGLSGVSFVTMGMMVPPLLPAFPAPSGDQQQQQQQPQQQQRQQQQLALDMQAGRGGFLDLLFPGFDVSTLIWKISALQMLEYGASCLMGSSFGAPKLCSLYLLGASWGPSIANGAIWRLFFPMVLHANALHIFFNMFFQLRIGFQMEKQFGRRKFCLLYVFCGFLGNLLSVAFDPMKLAVGASTSGFGLLGVWLAEVILTWELLGNSRPRVFLWFAFMVLSCVMMSTISPNVDFVGHFGGALAGFLMALILADMRDEHQPSWYAQAKTIAKNAAALLILAALFKVIALGPEGPIPYCGSILKPRQLPF